MELVDVDTQHAYDRIRESIITLQLAPGALVNEQQLAEELHMSPVAIREALKLLAHDELVVITPRHGLYVADINLPDLEQISEVRLTLEPLCAGLAAQRKDPADKRQFARGQAIDEILAAPVDGVFDFDLVDSRLGYAIVKNRVRMELMVIRIG